MEFFPILYMLKRKSSFRFDAMSRIAQLFVTEYSIASRKWNVRGAIGFGTSARGSCVANDTFIVWPTAIKTKDPVLPLPAGHGYAR